MFGNKCKCKTKICKCGKRKIGGMVKSKSAKERESIEERKSIEEGAKEDDSVEEREHADERADERAVIGESYAHIFRNEENEKRLIEIQKEKEKNLTFVIEGLVLKIARKRELEKKKLKPHSNEKNELNILTNENNKEDFNIKLTEAKNELREVKRSLEHKEESNPLVFAKKPPNKGIYNFSDDTNIYCFSDIESNMPNEIKELMFQNTENKIDYTLIDLVNAKKAIVFTGDLIDRGAYTIRNLLNMLKLKEKYPDNVILIGGNRDVNKIRMYYECCIPSIESKIFNTNTNSITDIIELLKNIPDNKIFKHSICEIADTLNIEGIVNPLGKYKETPDAIKRKIVDINFVESYRNDIFRIMDMYANTLGSLNQVKFFRDEFNVLFGSNDKDKDLFGFTDENFENDQFKKEVYTEGKYKLLLKFIAMMNMVMGKYRKESTEEFIKLPQCLQKYNGLYIKYIEKNHIMAAFTKKNNLYITSHSGIPYGKSATQNDTKDYFFIPSKIGEAPSNPENQDYVTNIEKLNSDFNTFIINVKDNKINYNDEEFKKYVAMVANCKDTTITGLNSTASPIVSSATIDKMRGESVNSLNIFNNNGHGYRYSKIYNIFGHQPGGFTPYVNRVRDNDFTSYHINLDISKAENPAGISNKKTYVYLLIDAKATEGAKGTEGTEATMSNDMLIGKIESNAPYVNVTINNQGTEGYYLEQTTPPQPTQATQALVIKYNIKLDEYCDNKIQAIKYNNILSPLFLVNDAYYGMFGYALVRLNKVGIGEEFFKAIKMKGGKKKINKIYIKSNKRYMYGKRRMVIYLGKRGCEYVKTAGEYLSLAKFIRTNNKYKNKNKK